MNPSSASSDSMDTDALRRARELLPWHAQGLLAGDDQAFMTHWLENTMAHHPTLAAQWQLELAAEQAWLHSTRTHLKATAQAQAAQQASVDNETQGLAALMQRIAQGKNNAARSEAGATNIVAGQAVNTWTTSQYDYKNSSKQAVFAAPGWLKRIFAWLDNALGVRSPALAFGIAAVVLAQAGVIGALLLSNPAQQAPLSGSAPVAAPAGQVLITVAFSPQTTELAMRQALAAAGAQVVAGPSALGLYSVAVPAANANAAITQLRAAKGVVDSVQP